MNAIRSQISQKQMIAFLSGLLFLFVSIYTSHKQQLYGIPFNQKAVYHSDIINPVSNYSINPGSVNVISNTIYSSLSMNNSLLK